jgi:hypothetical protein
VIKVQIFCFTTDDTTPAIPFPNLFFQMELADSAALLSPFGSRNCYRHTMVDAAAF